MTDYVTSKLGLRLPLGALGSTATAAGTVTSFKSTAFDAAVIEGANVTIVDPTDWHLVGRATINTVDLVSSPKVVTFNETLGEACASGDLLFLDEAVDVETWINANMDILDRNLGAFVCTNATRPTGTNRYTGQVIFETDTTNLYRWTGAAWTLLTSIAARLTGYVAWNERTTIGTAVGDGAEQATPHQEVIIPFVIGRAYRLHFSGGIFSNQYLSNSYIRWRYAPAAGALTSASSLLVQMRSDHPDGAAGLHLTSAVCQDFVFPNTTLSGNYKYGNFLTRAGFAGGKTVQFNASCVLYVEDVGLI